MFLSKYTVLPLTLCIVVLQGCSGTGGTPESDNVFGAAGGLSSGRYEAQTQQKRNEVLESREAITRETIRRDNLERTSLALQRQKQQLINEVRFISQQNNTLQREIDTLLVKGATDKVKGRQAQAKLRTIQQQTQRLRAKIAADSSNRNTDSYQLEKNKLKREIAALRAEYLRNNQ